MSLFKVNSTIKHNGSLHSAGSMLEGSVEEFGHLVKDGVLTLLNGNDTQETAPAPAPQQQEAPAHPAATETQEPEDHVITDPDTNETVTPTDDPATPASGDAAPSGDNL